MAKITFVSGYKAHEIGVFKNNDPSVSFIKKAIKKHLTTLIDEGLEWVLISGQLGTELWAAEVVFELQDEGFDHIKLAVFTPFLNQEENWKEEKKEWYESILLQADYVNSITNKPYEKPWQFRLKNQFLIDKSDTLLLFFDGERDGSPKYVYETALNYQKKHSYDIRLIDFYELQSIVEEEQLRNMWD
ncbi:SLOG family protein [Bacillus dakarensis]|uniref:SLOG family protein n=1 Tax=Robertmurraya dakarensis TaxID=1926278 RepID=UPI0009808B8F|nr:DUF1273 domain-containing protein [Bacillus dakarensis]